MRKIEVEAPILTKWSLVCVSKVDLAQSGDPNLFLLWPLSCVALWDRPSSPMVNFRWIHNILWRLHETDSGARALLCALCPQCLMIMFLQTFASKIILLSHHFTFCLPTTFWYRGKKKKKTKRRLGAKISLTVDVFDVHLTSGVGQTTAYSKHFCCCLWVTIHYYTYIFYIIIRATLSRSS